MPRILGNCQNLGENLGTKSLSEGIKKNLHCSTLISRFQLWESQCGSFKPLCYCSVTHSCPTLCKPMDCSTPVFCVLHHLPELAQTHVLWVSDTSNHVILCHLLLFLPSMSPSIRVFSNESALRIRWPMYWSFSISPSSEYSGLISDLWQFVKAALAIYILDWYHFQLYSFRGSSWKTI